MVDRRGGGVAVFALSFPWCESAFRGCLALMARRPQRRHPSRRGAMIAVAHLTGCDHAPWIGYGLSVLSQ